MFIFESNDGCNEKKNVAKLSRELSTVAQRVNIEIQLFREWNFNNFSSYIFQFVIIDLNTLHFENYHINFLNYCIQSVY